MDNDTQRDLFSRAVQLLGGQQATAAALGINDRSVRMLLQGERRLHPGILEDLCKALIAHADECRRIERKLSPAFASNRTDEQDRPPHHDGGRRAMPNPDLNASLLARKMRTALQACQAAGREPARWDLRLSTWQMILERQSTFRYSPSRQGRQETLFGLPFAIVFDGPEDDVVLISYAAAGED